MYKSRIPFVPTPQPVVKRMLELTQPDAGEVLYDLGAGDGRIIIEAAKRFDVKSIGIEIDPMRADAVRKKIQGLKDVVLLQDDFFMVNLSKADFVTVYLLPEVNLQLKPKFERELKTGARVVSHDYPIQGWRPDIVERVVEGSHCHNIFLYTMRDELRSSLGYGRGRSKSILSGIQYV